jgi:Ca2+-binding EF-hand superfamily protein
MVEQKSHLADVFQAYCGKDTTMDGKSFAKVAKDLKLIDPENLTATDVDLIFAKIKEKGARRINFTEF